MLKEKPAYLHIDIVLNGIRSLDNLHFAKLGVCYGTYKLVHLILRRRFFIKKTFDDVYEVFSVGVLRSVLFVFFQKTL